MNTNSNTSNGDNTAVAVVITDKLNDKVIIVISNMTDNDEIFTAFDVTKRIRQENPTMNVPHNDVRDMVLDSFRTDFCDDYSRECIDLTVARAFVYYPDNESPYDHPLAVKPSTPDTDTSDPKPKRTADPDSMLTVEKRLNIDKMLLVNLGLVPGKLVKVETISGVMSLTATTDTSGTTLVVNADGRLRLNSRTLTEAFGTLPKQYDIYSNSDITAIIVKPA